MRDPRDAGDCLWTTWKASPAAKGARRLRLPATWNARGRCTSTSAGATRSPVMRCARRCVERAVALQDCANYFALPKYSEVPLQHCARSEEHTSELQSRQYLVCRLLLEKKKDPSR